MPTVRDTFPIAPTEKTKPVLPSEKLRMSFKKFGVNGCAKYMAKIANPTTAKYETNF